MVSRVKEWLAAVIIILLLLKGQSRILRSEGIITTKGLDRLVVDQENDLNYLGRRLAGRNLDATR